MSENNLPNIGAVATAEIDGLAIRYARSGASKGMPILLTAPWPESIYAFYHLAPRLAATHRVIIVDLPGFGLSQSRADVMAPEAMGDFVIKLLKYFGFSRVHAVAPDVGTPAVLFAASKQQELFESLVIGGAAMKPDLAGGALKDLIHSPEGYLANAGADGVKPYLEQAALLTPAAIIEDFRAASAGRRLEEATQFVRGYIHDLPKLEPLLLNVKTPSLILSGKHDAIVPPVNLQFLADRLPNNRHLLLEAEHRLWEEAADEYNKTIVSWLDGDYRSLLRAL
ncbi:alpha/beta fold hydrolase [Chryseolinea soli]|uniref:Alpha/beta hydrolase n=1 Tax=Chryseolinea soli TaxID=2321403 RepID=A0A385SVJ8_9BACT|nr:alpha/beta hydrolase [Chryseolinea soli]AYB34842.1 alpha/beta hydrolase [Chryseolinea soli]